MSIWTFSTCSPSLLRPKFRYENANYLLLDKKTFKKTLNLFEMKKNWRFAQCKISYKEADFKVATLARGH